MLAFDSLQTTNMSGDREKGNILLHNIIKPKPPTPNQSCPTKAETEKTSPGKIPAQDRADSPGSCAPSLCSFDSDMRSMKQPLKWRWPVFAIGMSVALKVID